MSQPDEKCPGCGHVEHKNRDKRCQVDMGHRFCNCLEGVTFSAPLSKPAPPIAQDTMREGPYKVVNHDIMGWQTFGPGQSAMGYLMAYADDSTEAYPNIYCHNLNVAYDQGVASRDAEIAALKAHPTGQQEAALRDYTPEEALEEANHRWGEGAALGLTRGKLASDYWLSSGKGTAFFGSSFRAAFAKADKALESSKQTVEKCPKGGDHSPEQEMDLDGPNVTKGPIVCSKCKTVLSEGGSSEKRGK